jgi:hypothetical protein
MNEVGRCPQACSFGFGTLIKMGIQLGAGRSGGLDTAARGVVEGNAVVRLRVIVCLLSVFIAGCTDDEPLPVDSTSTVEQTLDAPVVEPPTKTEAVPPSPTISPKSGDITNSEIQTPETATDEIDKRPTFSQRPTIRANLNPNAPLAAWIDFATNRPVRGAVDIDDGQRQWAIAFDEVDGPKYSVLLLGFRPGRSHTIRVTLHEPDGDEKTNGDGKTIGVEKTIGDGKTISDPLDFKTPPLPDDFPPLELVTAKPDAMEPGVTLFGVNRWLNDAASLDYGYLIAVDGQGEVVWYFRTGHAVADLRRMAGGNLLYNHGSNWHAYESDMLGNVIRHWYAANLVDDAQSSDAIAVPVDTFHHEILELPTGNLLAISTELKKLKHFPVSEAKPSSATGPATVVADVLVEFSLDGKVVNRQPVFDLLDTRRIGYGSLSGFWDTRAYRDVKGGSKDWSHSNGMFYDPTDDSLIVSLRHQDAVIKLSRATGEIQWILGNHYDWRRKWQPLLLKAEGNLRWPYHQHAPKITPAGTLLLFDNGNYRAKPFKRKTPAAKNFSRVVEFRIDEAKMTVAQVWEYRGENGETFYCPFFCEADWLPVTGNILITEGGHVHKENGEPSDDVPADHQWARILEVTHTTPANKVFEIRIDSGAGSDKGWSVYRSERLPSLFP